MKRALMTFLAAFITLCGAQAQTDLRILNHLSVGAEVSSLGIGVDASMPITPFIDVQAGYTIFPGFKFNTVLGLTHPTGELEKVPVKAKPMMKGGKVLVNVMPLPMLTSFHVTAGIYFGSDNMTSIYSTELIPHSTAVLGDYLLQPDAEGNIDAVLKVKPVKTYLGIGIGRGVPKGRIGFKMDIGCLLWGKPSVYCNDVKVEDTDADGGDAKLLKVMTKLKVYPVVSFRVCGKIF
ncbi:MAG: hypothetical protein IJ219_02555 [Bacteroidaceae bacterium]|nr:hypothetical protein [Bacteroidaceae bacterium]MBQ9171114.1 hypothetical protein [Bacteroidaceae bacterium]MBQ9293795.1 hypothetical protein [Bacteroidaceae bacterium]